MKGNYKLAAAVSLTLLAGNAAAAITTGSGTTPGSLVFSAVNDQTKQTFVLNLGLATTTGISGLDYADFAGNKPGEHGFSTDLSTALAANNGKLTWNLNIQPAFSGFVSNVANLRWSVLGGYAKNTNDGSNIDKLNVDGYGEFYADPFNTQWGALVTAPSKGHLDENNNSFEQNPSGSGTTGAYLGAVKSKLGAADAGSIADVNGTAFYDTKVTGWTGALLPGVPTKNGAGDYEFIWATNPFFDGKNQFTTLGKFTLGTDSTLTFTSNQVSQVPVPAAIWMFGSALVGLLGISRRKSTALQA